MASNKTVKTRKSAATTRSTAGPGYAFEDMVAADLLGRFLLDMPIPGMNRAGTKLLSQAAAAGWVIDDLVCVTEGPKAGDGAAHLAISCKSNVQVTASGWPSEFIEAAWRMWRGGPPFGAATDRIALVTRGRNTRFDATWSDLKSWCTDADPELALARINASQTHRRLFDSVSEPGAHEGEVPADEETLALIARLDIYPLDFQLEPSRDLEQTVQRCRSALVSQDLREAQRLWEALVGAARDARLGNGVVSLANLIRDLAPKFALRAHPSIAPFWEALMALAADERATIEPALPNGHKVSRDTERQALAEMVQKHSACLVIGDSGVGKSALIADALEEQFTDAQVIWLGSDILKAALSQARRQSVGIGQDLGAILALAPGADKVLVLDSLERLTPKETATAARLVERLSGDPSWKVILATQTQFEQQLLAAGISQDAPVLRVTAPAESAIAAALRSVPGLAWIAHDDAVLPLFANLRTLGWVVSAETAFRRQGGDAPRNSADIADRLWQRWTEGPAATRLQSLLMRLAERDAAYERSFAISKLGGDELAAFDLRSEELPLLVNARNHIEFSHDLASDWARFQKLKEIADDTEEWAALASEPLWIPALRLLGQFLLAQPDQARGGWDRAFEGINALALTEAGDVMLDALCLDPSLDKHLETRIESFLAEDGALLKRLLNRFLHVATVPAVTIPGQFGADLRLHMEAEMRTPIWGRWPPLARFFDAHCERIGAMGAAIVARVCKVWLGMPARLGGNPFPLRDIFARVALATARTEQVAGIARRFHGYCDRSRLIHEAALAGAPDLPDDVGAFALEMARRRPLAPLAQDRVAAIRDEDRQTREALAALPRQRKKSFGPSIFAADDELPPWPLGPQGRVAGGFREAILHGSALVPLMAVRPEIASEVLLACMIKERPVRESGQRIRMDDNLGLVFDQSGYPTAFWKSPFLTFLQTDPDAALGALGQLLDFAVGQWASEAPEGTAIPGIGVPLPAGDLLQFPGTPRHFGWSQTNSTHNGNLFAALDALERWLILKLESAEDVDPLCERILSMGCSVALLGILVNLGKHRPALFSGVLRPLVGIEDLYWWDNARVAHVSMGFDAFTWSRQGEIIYEFARSWILAGHRTITMRQVIGDLAAQDSVFGTYLQQQTAAWPPADERKDRLEQRMLQAELDPANRQPVTDEESGETFMRTVYPTGLAEDVLAFQGEGAVTREPITLPFRCRQALSQTKVLSGEECAYLAKFLPAEGDAELPDDDIARTAIAAAAATLMARGEDWLSENIDVRRRSERVLNAVIDPAEGDEDHNRYLGDEALAFAALGAFYNALRDPSWESALVRVIMSGDRGAIAALMTSAYRHRELLGSAWYRLNHLLVLAAGLDHLASRFEGDDRGTIWRKWRERLESYPIFGVEETIDAIDPRDIARRAERLRERRQKRLHPDREWHRTGRGRQFAGLNNHTLEAGFRWLLEPDDAWANAAIRENHAWLAKLWAFEVWRIAGDPEKQTIENSDEEYDLPSDLGYAILRVAPQFILARCEANEVPLWQDILMLGPDGHAAVEQFAASWFLMLFRDIDQQRFMATWQAMLEQALTSDWFTGRRWFYGRRLMVHLLGMHATTELAHDPRIVAALRNMRDFYRRWAQTGGLDSEDGLTSFSRFLAEPAGAFLRLDGMKWLNEAIAKLERLYRSETGVAVAEALDALLRSDADRLMENVSARNAAIAVAARLVAMQVPAAMGLQARLGAIR